MPPTLEKIPSDAHALKQE